MEQGAVWPVLSRAAARGLRRDGVHDRDAAAPRTRAGRTPASFRRKVCVLAIGVLTSIALAGCSEPDTQPPSVPTSSVEPTPTPTPTISAVPHAAPTRPAEMEQGDERGAAAAARYFLELFPYVMSSQDLTTWSSVTASDCNYCDQVVGWVEADVAAEHRYIGGEVELGEVVVLPQDPTVGGFTVQIPFTQSGAQILDASGDEVRSDASYSTIAFVDVLFTPSGWSLVELSTAEEPLA